MKISDANTLIVCVGLADILDFTLARNAHKLGRILVVSSFEDNPTRIVANNYSNVDLFQTDAFYRNGAVLNKGAAVEEGFDVLGRDGWILVLDCDIILPDYLDLSNVKPGYLYSVKRRCVDSWLSYEDGMDWSSLPICYEEPGAGYFQLFHASDPVLAHKPWYGVNWTHCGGCDSDFMEKWPHSKRVWLHGEVVHLGVPGVNWMGRVVPDKEGRVPFEAEARRKRLDYVLASRSKFGFSHERSEGWLSPEYKERLRGCVEQIRPRLESWPLPKYVYDKSEDRPRVFFTQKKFEDHMSDEAFQLQEGLRLVGYELVGEGFDDSRLNVAEVCKEKNPSVVILQDKREWDHWDCSKNLVRFVDYQVLGERDDIFRVTIFKDIFYDTPYQMIGHKEFKCHAYIHYYNPDMILYTCPWIQRKQLIRTYHSVDSQVVPEYTEIYREGAVVSGAVSLGDYPLRARIVGAVERGELSGIDVIKHPGFHTNGPDTPFYIRKLTRYKVSICTSSIYGFALRKLIESTAAGCVVITDLPLEDHLPWIDGNFVRVPNNISMKDLQSVVNHCVETYDSEKQYYFRGLCLKHYDYKVIGRRLFDEIELKRSQYNS